jgi:predicted transcriptional regulator
VFIVARAMKIGIKSREEFQKYTIEIAKGNLKPAKNDPKIWFDSVESMAQVLSTKNIKLLKTIKEQNPQSLTELAVTSERKLSNLSRTLKTMEKYGIVKLEKDGKSVKPVVSVDTFQADFGY